jgi:hypothetical protein
VKLLRVRLCHRPHARRAGAAGAARRRDGLAQRGGGVAGRVVYERPAGVRGPEQRAVPPAPRRGGGAERGRAGGGPLGGVAAGDGAVAGRPGGARGQSGARAGARRPPRRGGAGRLLRPAGLSRPAAQPASERWAGRQKKRGPRGLARRRRRRRCARARARTRGSRRRESGTSSRGPRRAAPAGALGARAARRRPCS